MIAQRDTQALLGGLGPSVHAPLLRSAERVTTPTENLELLKVGERKEIRDGQGGEMMEGEGIRMVVHL